MKRSTRWQHTCLSLLLGGLLHLVTGVWGGQNSLYVNVGGAQFQDFTVDPLTLAL